MVRTRFDIDPTTKYKYLVFYLIKGKEDIAATLPSKELKVLMTKKLDGKVIDTGKFIGIYEGEEAEKWFTELLGKPVLLLRSKPGFTKPCPKNKV